MWETYWSSESPPRPIRAKTPSGSRVMVMTTTLAVTGRWSHISSGYPTRASRMPASTVLRVSSIPPISLPESV